MDISCYRSYENFPFLLRGARCFEEGFDDIGDASQYLSCHHEIGDKVLTGFESLPHYCHSFSCIIENSHGVCSCRYEVLHHLDGFIFHQVCHEGYEFVVHLLPPIWLRSIDHRGTACTTGYYADSRGSPVFLRAPFGFVYSLPQVEDFWMVICKKSGLYPGESTAQAYRMLAFCVEGHEPRAVRND